MQDVKFAFIHPECIDNFLKILTRMGNANPYADSGVIWQKAYEFMVAADQADTAMIKHMRGINSAS